jgi:hypothetical protein
VRLGVARQLIPALIDDFSVGKLVDSKTKRLRVDFETAEAMLNHVQKRLERTYDTYELEEEKRAWFLTWETEIAGIALEAGVSEALGVPSMIPR